MRITAASLTTFNPLIPRMKFIFIGALFIVLAIGDSTASPPDAAALKSAGIEATIRDGGSAVDVRDAKSLNEETWKAIEALPNVKHFSTGGEPFDDAALLRLSRISSIETLFFNGPAITDAGLATLNNMPSLVRFGVDHSTTITGSGLAALKANSNLTAIHFGGCMIGDEAVRLLAHLTQLKDVSLGHVRITRSCFPALAALPNLERLEITPNWDPAPYTAADFAAFAPMQKLRELEIHDMVLPLENGLSHLKALKSLKTLKLYWSYITEADLAKLRAQMPTVDVDVRNPAGEDRLKQFNERAAQLDSAKRP